MCLDCTPLIIDEYNDLSRQVEHDLAWARFLVGLHGYKGRREVTEVVNGVMELGLGLHVAEDKLTTIMEAAQAGGPGFP